MRTLVKGAHFEGAHRSGRGFLEDESDVVAGETLTLASCPLVLAQACGKVHEVQELLFGEVRLLQQIASAQVRHGYIFSGHNVVLMSAISPELEALRPRAGQGRLGQIGRHFDRDVADRKIPGYLVLVSRFGKIAHVVRHGARDIKTGAPIEDDTRFRLYSMTKPVTSVAAMTCYEQGLIALDDPVSKFIPEFADTAVFAGGSSFRPATVPMSEPMRIWHLLTHTAGLTYGWMYKHPVDAMYRSAGFEWDVPQGLDLAASCRRLARLPLVCQPGTRGTTPWRPTSWGASSRSRRVRASRRSSPSASFAP